MGLNKEQNQEFHAKLEELLSQYQGMLLKEVCEQAATEPDDEGHVYDGSPLVLDSTVLVTCWRSMDGYTMTSIIVPFGQNPWLTNGLMRSGITE